MIDVGLVIARLLHYSATITLFGVSFFPLYACSGREPESVKRWRCRLLLPTAGAALLGGLLWFVFAVANMSGSLADVADPELIWSVVHQTGFGALWTARMGLAAVIAGLAIRRLSSSAARRDLITPLLSAVLLASLAGTGHSQVEDEWAGVVHVGADAAHLLAAGAWLGGLLPLGLILIGSTTNSGRAGSTNVDQILLRFSGMGYVAVATLVASGLINSWFLVDSLSNLLTTPYGQVLLGKLALFAAMVALAAANRFWIVPLMSATQAAVSGAPAAWTRRLRNHVLGEQFLGLIVLLVVSVLGTMHPAAGR